WLPEYLPDSQVIDYIEQADKILVGFGATTDRYLPDNELKKLCLQHDLHMQQAQLKHLGTDANLATMMRLVDWLGEHVSILPNTEVLDVDKDSHVLTLQTKSKERQTLEAKHIIFAVGRAGSQFFSDWCRKNEVRMMNNQVDIGVRVELPALIWEEFSSRVYEPKIWYRSSIYGDTTRVFCFNEKGKVVMENTGGILTVNGHSYRDASRKTENSNFALLTTIRFTQPFDEPIAYARAVASLANMISGGSVLVQRLGDLEQGRRTNAHRIAQGTVRPTLEAVPGDLSLCMPKRQIDNIIETLHVLDKIAPGTANYDTLLYGVECKYYSARPSTGEDFEIEGCHNMYAVGDGAGFTRSLAQAAAHGLHVGSRIISRDATQH
ncbi:MAG: FAD-dependent oxidoreductase, partial [Oscillospiraceae bacterium]